MKTLNRIPDDYSIVRRGHVKGMDVVVYNAGLICVATDLIGCSIESLAGQHTDIYRHDKMMCPQYISKERQSKKALIEKYNMTGKKFKKVLKLARRKEFDTLPARPETVILVKKGHNEEADAQA